METLGPPPVRDRYAHQRMQCRTWNANRQHQKYAGHRRVLQWVSRNLAAIGWPPDAEGLIYIAPCDIGMSGGAPLSRRFQELVYAGWLFGLHEPITYWRDGLKRSRWFPAHYRLRRLHPAPDLYQASLWTGLDQGGQS